MSCALNLCCTISSDVLQNMIHTNVPTRFGDYIPRIYHLIVPFFKVDWITQISLEIVKKKSQIPSSVKIIYQISPPPPDFPPGIVDQLSFLPFRCGGLQVVPEGGGAVAGGGAKQLLGQGWKFMSRSHCQKLCQWASWLLIGYTRVNNQSESSWQNSWHDCNS